MFSRLPASPRARLGLILALFVALALLYSVVTPIFEGPDEIWHFAFADHLARGNGLPVLAASGQDIWLRNAAHTPLYHFLVAAVIAPLDRSDFPAAYRFNMASPRVTPGGNSDRSNLFIHTSREDFPYRQSALAVHIGRLVSAVLGALTVLGVWKAARLLFPGDDNLPVLAAGLTAFIPQFVYGSGLVNNDVLAAAASTWLLVTVLGLTEKPTARRAALTGLLLGATLLSKIGMAALLPLPAVALALAFWSKEAGKIKLFINPVIARARTLRPKQSLALGGEIASPQKARLAMTDGVIIFFQLSKAVAARLRDYVGAGAMVYGVALAAAGWWYARNWVLYGDPLAWQQWQALAGVGRVPPTLLDFLGDMLGMFGMFWADFTLRVDRQLVWLFGLIALAALAGLARRVFRRDWPKIYPVGWWVSLLGLGLQLALVIRYGFMTYEIHGRLLYPMLAVISAGLALALTGGGRRLGRWFTGGALSIALTVTVLSPFVIIAPAYARPVISALPADVQRVSLRFGSAVELIGYRLTGERVSPGDSVRLQTYWQALVRPSSAQSLADLRGWIVLMRPDGKLAGKLEPQLGTSVYPTSEWLPGEIIVSDVTLPVLPASDYPAVADVQLGVRSETGFLVTESGDTVSLGRLSIRPSASCAFSKPVDVVFGGQIRLLGYRMEPTAVVLCWQAEQPPAADYTVFVHQFGPGGSPLVNADAPPRNGLYPTSAWAVGEQIEDRHNLAGRENSYLMVGLYQLESGERLAVDGTGATEVKLVP